MSTLAGGYSSAGIFDGTGTNVYFLHPRGIAVDSLGNQYVTDVDAHFVKMIATTGMATGIVYST